MRSRFKKCTISALTSLVLAFCPVGIANGLDIDISSSFSDPSAAHTLYPSDPINGSPHNPSGGTRIAGNQVQIYSDTVTGTPDNYIHTYGWNNSNTVGYYNDIDLKSNGWVVSGANTMDNGGENKFTMSSDTAKVNDGAIINVKGGGTADFDNDLGIFLYAGTVAGEIQTDMGHTIWRIAEGGSNNLTITSAGVLKTTGTAYNRFDIGSGTFQGQIIATNSGSNELNFNTGANFSGEANLKNATGSQSINLKDGLMSGNVHGSNEATTNTFTIAGGNSSGYLFGGTNASTSYFTLSSGTVRHIVGLEEGSAATEIATAHKVTDVTGNFFGGYDGSIGNHVNTLLNMHTNNTGVSKYGVNISGVLEIGSSVTLGEAQISADTVGVYSTGKLIINENSTTSVWNTTAVATGNKRNIINTLDIFGTVNINQTTIQGTNAGEAVINVQAGGTVQGFGQFTTVNDHNPMRANLLGDLNLEAGSSSPNGITSYGGTLKPYDSSYFGAVDFALKGVIFKVDADGGNGGATTFDKTSRLSTRLFAEEITGVQKNVYIKGTEEHQAHVSDSLLTKSANFANIFNGGVEVSQNEKAQYDPVFGFQYELVSKQEFEVYREDAAVDNTYYFNIANATERMTTYLGGYTDANHLFNRDIIKSDMLGEWWFDIGDTTNSSIEDKSIITRFRLLAAHPSQGGITIGMSERNAREAAKVLDTWRYPFETDYNQSIAAGLGQDPSIGTGPSSALDYGPGYDGNMQTWYANTTNPLIDNYRFDYIADFEHLLLGIQREITGAAVLNRAIRQLHPESYATMTNVNFNLLDRFVQNRERNAVSSLFQVETQQYAEAVKKSLGISSTVALASPAAPCDDVLNIEQFVANPVRYWASGFGQKGNRKRRGDEYGYDSEVYGGSIGLIKECGDVYYGITANYARAKSDFDELHASAVTHAYMGELLYGVRRDLGFMEAFASYGYHEQKMNRHVNMAGGFYEGNARGEYHDDVTNIGVRFGYQHVFKGNWLFIPTLGFQYHKSENGAFTEKAREDMSVAFKFEDGGIKREAYKAPVTLRLLKSFVIRDFVITPEVRATGSLYFGKRHGTATTVYVGMPISGLQFKAYGLDAGRYEATIGTTIELSRYGRFYVAANYDYSMRKQYNDHSYSVQFGLNF